MNNGLAVVFVVSLLIPDHVEGTVASHWTDELELPKKLLEYKIRNDEGLKKKCLEDSECSITPELLNNGRCWGFESTCAANSTYSAEFGLPKCRKNLPNPRTKQTFYDQGDFGYLKERQLLSDICVSKEEGKTTLACSGQLRYCSGRNIFFDFRSFKAKGSARYRNDIIHSGEVGGNCEKFYPTAILANLQHKSYLQSWAFELEHFKSYDDFRVDKQNCDVIFERPTVIIKLDAAMNLYHHMCDFVNLYASQFINDTNFDRDIDIVWWDTADSGFVDTYFGAFWGVFSRRKPIELISLAGKKVCFKNFVLPLLARQYYGLFYNMPLTEGCHGSGLMQAFTEHSLFRLGIKQDGPFVPEKIRITILSRSTRYRKILNLDQLNHEISKLPNVELKIVDYNKDVPFLKQLEQTHNSDIFIGMHGSGLTHMLFLPNWAAVFEIYNCDDELCYLDLARLRSVKYWTWPKDKIHLVFPESEGIHPQSGKPHRKFANYSFDPKLFGKIVKDMIEYVKRHPKYVEELRKKKRDLRSKQNNNGNHEL
ncbi:hypothetical protein WR25_26337 [Diploscapter pachys]|uniref:EGF domain-specific O-linked N-acetylglucosamine transferase n=1 Tax=Diploscapter pachys TaxID=2018661 RepID=A0A2A2KU85_9BILA|nr:hypothetical protein WR25_26337 [Diploscapter pachys]